MTILSAIRRPLLRVPSRQPMLISAMSAAFGAAATVSVIAGWSAFGPVNGANASGQTTSASASTLRSYPASRDGHPWTGRRRCLVRGRSRGCSADQPPGQLPRQP